MLFPSHRSVFALALVISALPIAVAAQQPVGELYASDASVKGSVLLAGSGTRVLSGSSIQAGAQPATLKLDRGGNVLVCEGTKLSLSSSQTGRELLLSLNTGNLELNYPLGTEADTLLTPDLRLMLPGPGTVHVAVRVTSQGDTCVQSLPWNQSAITISETMGDATYQVKPDEAVLFKGGHLTQASRSQENCGCPRSVPMAVAKSEPPPASTTTSAAKAGTTTPAPTSTPTPAPTANMTPTPTAEAAPAPPEQHLAVEAPFVYRGSDPIPDLSENVAVLKLENTRMVQLEPTVLPPAKAQKPTAQPATQTAKKKESRGFFAKLGSFFAGIFH